MKEPNFFIIGAPKSGTTALASYLSEHPQVFMSDPKEPHHYNTDIEHGSFKDRNRYLALFEPANRDHIAVGEASVWYLYSRDAVPRILGDYASAKFLVMLRNPIDMAPSLHEQMVFSGFESAKVFWTAWMLQNARREGRQVPTWCPDRKLLLYKSACSIGAQYARLRRLVPPENLLPILFDDFRDSPRDVWLSVMNFLRVDDDGRKAFPAVNAAKERRSMFLKRLSDSYAAGRSRLGFAGFGTGLWDWIARWNISERRRPPQPSELRSLLETEFAGEIETLSKALGRDLEGWVSG